MSKPILMLAALGALPLAAATELHGTASVRSAHKLGLELGALGDPLPQPFGVALGYNVFDFLRLQAQYGVGYATSLGVGHSLTGGAVLMVPGWSLTPTVGLHYATVFGPNNDATPTGFGHAGDHLFATAGLDWQLKSGVSFGVGMNVALQKTHSLGMPYVRIGFYF